MTTRIVLACDESGAKGYADQVETFPGEVGVIAGILIPDVIEPKARPIFQRIYSSYRPASGKLHIADLPPIQQEALRQDLWEAIRELNLPCFWYAIHVQGLNDWYLASKTTKVIETQQPRVKRGSPRDNPLSMHEELFSGLYAHLIAFLEERGQRELEIEVRTDQIDSPIARSFENIAKKLLSDEPRLKTVKGWDTVTNQMVEGTIEIKVLFPSDFQINVAVRELTLKCVGDGDGYVLAADVLANSLNHLFKNRSQAELYSPLNQLDAIAVHPIANQLATFDNWGAGDIIGDRLYRHPKCPAP